MRNVVFPIMILSAATAIFAQTTAPANAPAVSPTAAPAKVPEQTLRQIEEQFAPPATQPTPEQINQRMLKVIELGRQAEKDYPNASNLTPVRLAMLQAADYLRRIKGDKESVQTETEICRRILDSNAKPQEKVQADFVCTLLKVRPDPQKPASNDAGDQIKKFAERYHGTDIAGQGYAFAAMLAIQADQDPLKKQYVQVLKDKHIRDPQVKSFLKQLREYSEIGQPFEATLTRLDGSKLNLPEDLQGKVVVVDFWAAWCPPCAAEAPKLKALYEKYKGQGVEFVGISLDTDKAKMEQFIRQQNLGWIQTYSGADRDPTALKYAVTAIPTVYVVGKDGRIVSDNAGEQLEDVLQRALKAKYDPSKAVVKARAATQPAPKPE